MLARFGKNTGTLKRLNKKEKIGESEDEDVLPAGGDTRERVCMNKHAREKNGTPRLNMKKCGPRTPLATPLQTSAVGSPIPS
jgi:hypothetical protein